MNAPVYQITGGPSVPGINFPSAYIPAGVPTSQVNNYERPLFGGSGDRQPATRPLYAGWPAIDVTAARLVGVRSEHY